MCASEQMKKDVRLTFASLGGINEVTKCISAFPKHIDIQGEACGALFAVCCESPTNKKNLMESGGLDAIISAFDVNRGVIESTDDDSLSFYIRACAGKGYNSSVARHHILNCITTCLSTCCSPSLQPLSSTYNVIG
jgi:hypothetical protein